MNKLITLLTLLLLLTSCSQNGPAVPDAAKQKTYAGMLYEKELYKQAADAYEKLLELPGLNEREKTGALYRAAEIRLDKTGETEEALALFLKIRALYPESETAVEAGKKIVECLEKTGRSLDARNEQSRLAALKPEAVDTGMIVAKIGNRSITMTEIEKADGFLEKDKSRKIEQVRRFVAGELLYQSAVRSGWDKDPQIHKQVEKLRKTLVMNKVLEKELTKMGADTSLAEEYFKAHRKKFVDSLAAAGKPKPGEFKEYRARVIREMKNEKQQQAYQAMMTRLLQTEDVQIFGDKIK